MYVSRLTPINPDPPQLEFGGDQGHKINGLVWTQLLVVMATFAIGAMLETVSPGALAYIALPH